MTSDAWASYFYPETYDPVRQHGTLRNLFDERDDELLRRLEYGATAQRARELGAGAVSIPRTYDAAHVRAIHRHLFGDVYAWAGEYRSVPIFTGTPRGFADPATGEIDRYLADVRRLVVGTRWEALDRGDFAERTATVFAHLNQAHPFREGNGRTAKVFMSHVAERSQFSLDYSRVTPEQWNEASKWSGPDLFAYEPHPAELVPVFRAIAVERQALAPTDGDLRGRAARQASYGSAPATDAVRRRASGPRRGARPAGVGYDPSAGRE